MQQTNSLPFLQRSQSENSYLLSMYLTTSHGHHHTENLSTAAAIEVMESVVRHGDFAFWLLTTKENGALWFEWLQVFSDAQRQT